MTHEWFARFCFGNLDVKDASSGRPVTGKVVEILQLVEQEHRISIFKMLLKHNDMEPFLKRIITGNEKWVKYENIKLKRSWSKADDSQQTIYKPRLTDGKQGYVKCLVGLE